MVEEVPGSKVWKVKEIQTVNGRVRVDGKVHQDACFVQSGEEGHLGQTVVLQNSMGNALTVGAAGAAEGDSTSGWASRDSSRNCSAPGIRSQIVV